MSTKQPEFSVIIPVFNKWDLTLGCLKSLREHSGGHAFEVIVVDNASSDATATDLAPLGESLFGDAFAAIRFEENRNFGPACNVGAKAAGAPVLFFLNNDTLLTPGWAAPLLSALRGEPELGAVGPLLLYANETVQHLGVVYSPQGALHLYRDFPRSHPVVARRRDLSCLTGAAVMLGRDLFFGCDGFYEGYRNGYEDQELCARIRQAGKKLACIPESVVYHLESQSSGRHEGESHNVELFFRRCGKLVRSDFHIHAARDGFEVFLNDLFRLSLKLPDAEERRLTREAQDKPPHVWASMMGEHPLWIGGLELFANLCAKRGEFEKELPFRLRLADLRPTLERYLDVLQLEPHFPQGSPWTVKFREHLGFMELYRGDEKAATRRMRFFQKKFPPENPAFFERLCREKAARMFPGRVPRT